MSASAESAVRPLSPSLQADIQAALAQANAYADREQWPEAREVVIVNLLSLAVM